MVTVENEAGVFFAKKGYYKGKEVTVTHHDGSMVWLEDYPVRDEDGLLLGCWVQGDSVTYIDDLKALKRKNKRRK